MTRTSLAHRAVYSFLMDWCWAGPELTNDKQNRRTAVAATLSANPFAAPATRSGEVLRYLASAGVLKRGVLLGFHAYQTYGSTLGFLIPELAVKAPDSKDNRITIGVEQGTASLLPTLKKADATFAELPGKQNFPYIRQYRTDDGLIVETDAIVEPAKRLSAIALPETAAVELLQFLTAEPKQAVVLHGAGIPVLVPSPDKYAVHQLITARLRRLGGIEDYARAQINSLLPVLGPSWEIDLYDAWREAWDMGFNWQQRLIKGLAQLEPDIRDRMLQRVCFKRAVIPGLNLIPLARGIDGKFRRGAVVFWMQSEYRGTRQKVRCDIEADALVEFGSNSVSEADCLQTFKKRKRAILKLARIKYLLAEVEKPNTIFIRQGDSDIYEHATFGGLYDLDDLSEDEQAIEESFGYDAAEVTEWVKGWGTKHEKPRPKRKTLKQLLGGGDPKATPTATAKADRFPSQEALKEMVERDRISDKSVGIDGDELEAWLDADDPNAPLPRPKKISAKQNAPHRKKRISR